METDRFFATSGIQVVQHDRGQFHYLRAGFSFQLKSKCGNLLTKTTVLQIMLKSTSHLWRQGPTQPSVSETCRSLSFSFESFIPPTLIYMFYPKSNWQNPLDYRRQSEGIETNDVSKKNYNWAYKRPKRHSRDSWEGSTSDWVWDVSGWSAIYSNEKHGLNTVEEVGRRSRTKFPIR
jgi:hypothetical protein